MKNETPQQFDLCEQTDREVIPLFELVQNILNSFYEGQTWKQAKSEAA